MIFTHAFLLGLMLAIPIGPIAMLILQRSLQVGWLAGLSSGLGAAGADAILAFLAALGLSALMENLTLSRHLIRPIGALLLIGMGLSFIFRSPPKLEPKEVLATRYLQHYLWDALTSFLLTIMNPLTLMAYAAVLTGTNLIPLETKKMHYAAISSGFFFGSLTWWTLLVFLAEQIRPLFSPKVLHKIFVGLGIVLIALACFSVSGRLAPLIEKFHKTGMHWRNQL